jgi:hypothetical protein
MSGMIWPENHARLVKTERPAKRAMKARVESRMAAARRHRSTAQALRNPWVTGMSQSAPGTENGTRNAP